MVFSFHVFGQTFEWQVLVTSKPQPTVIREISAPPSSVIFQNLKAAQAEGYEMTGV